MALNSGGGIYSSNINGTNFVLNSTSNNDPEYSKVIIRNNQAVNGGIPPSTLPPFNVKRSAA